MSKGTLRSRGLVAGLLTLSLSTLTLGGCGANAGTGPATTGASPAQVNILKSQVADLKGRVTTLEALAPGLGEFMMSIQTHMAKAWYGAEAGNWDLAKFELGEASETFDGAEASRPEDATSLKAFVSGPLASVQTAVKAKDKTGFETSYKSAISGCTACHAGTIDRPKNWPNGRGFIKIAIPPTTNPFNQDFTP